MMILLTALAAALSLLFLGVVAVGLVKISTVLRSIGGTPTSYLAKLRLGLRAIETETSHLEPQVVRVNQQLNEVLEGLRSVDEHLVGTISAAGKQQRYQ